jgi:NAD(P)-dependent dehydrogenase (short-subunit alcohol dehydrogenase family)
MGMTSGKAQTASGRTAMYRLGSSERADLPLGVAIGAGTMGMAAARRMAQRYRVLIADIDAHVAELGGLGGLAHCAGLSPSLGDYATILRVNLTGVALVAGALLPHARPGSAAVLIASLAAHNFRPSDAAIEVLRDPAAPDLPDRLAAVIGPENATPPMAYVYSKWGILAYARRQAAAWGAKGARIVSLSPGLIATSQGALEFEKSPGKRAMYERTPLAREGTMLEIADAIEFLLSERASFISGTDLLVDGGLAGTLGGD